MNGSNPDFRLPVVTDWEDLKHCPFAEKRWVNPSDVDEEKDYEKGDFLRVFCNHDIGWCSAENGYECCTICLDHLKE